MRAAIGQDSHRFEEQEGKPLVLGGVVFPEERKGFLANSDGDQDALENLWLQLCLLLTIAVAVTQKSFFPTSK